MEFGKELTLTCILRTPEEQAALYAPAPPPPSPHCNWEAADIRSSVFTDAEIKKMMDFLNNFEFRNGKPVGLYHQLPGNAFHFHIQYAKG